MVQSSKIIADTTKKGVILTLINNIIFKDEYKKNHDSRYKVHFLNPYDTIPNNYISQIMNIIRGKYYEI